MGSTRVVVPDSMRALRTLPGGGLAPVRVPVPQAGPGEVLVRVSRAAVNFLDVGLSAAVRDPAAPGVVPGLEVAGVRAADGARVVALCGAGGYAEWAVAPAAAVFPVPDRVSDHAALSVFVAGLTAWHLVHTIGATVAGDTVVVHSAAGGVGALATQLAHRAGAIVVATASTAQKRALALDLGAARAVDGAPDGLAERLRAAANGPVDVVLERDGGRVFDESLVALGPLGRLVVYGTASGSQPVMSGALISRSQSVRGFVLSSVLTPAHDPAGRIAALLANAESGALSVLPGRTFDLAEAALAHRELVSRRTTGKLTLRVGDTEVAP